MKMKKISTSFAIICVLILFSACQEESKEATPKPTAHFEFDNPDSTTREVQFQNKSKHADTYYWDFGDGQASTLPNPKHQYKQGGLYTVRLNAIGEGGANNISKTVNILAFPAANFAFTSGGCVASCEVHFRNQSINANSFAWDFGDGERSEEKNPTHLYTRGGNFTVRLIAKNQTYTSKFQKTIHIRDSVFAPVADFKIKGSGCVASCEVAFINTSKNATSFLWDLGNGTQTRVRNPKCVYPDPGIYTIRLIARGEGGVDEFVRTLYIKEN